jgi:zinc transport system substrate-binding protein
VKCLMWKGVLFLSVMVNLLCFNSIHGMEKEKASLSLFVSILPQAYFVERVGGSNVEVEVLVGPGQSPATFELTPQQMAKLTQADAYFRIGLPFEKQLVGKIQTALSDLRVVDTRQGIQLRTMENEHHNNGSDPHIWLDPKLAKVQAATVCKELCLLDSTNATEYEENLKAFKADLDEVDAKITQALESLKGRKFYVFHPSYGYFGDAYGLTQVAVEIEGKEPGARQLAELIDQAKEDSVKVIFVQPQFSARSAEAVAEAIKGVVVPIDPLARDYLKNLEDIAEKIMRGLAKEKE